MKGKEKSTLLASAAMPSTRGTPAAWEIALLFGSGVWLLLKDGESRCKSRKFVALRCCCPLAGTGERRRWQQVALQARRAGLCLGAGGLSEQPELGIGESSERGIPCFSGWNGPGGSCSPCASVLALPKPPSISLVFSVLVCGSRQAMLEGSCRGPVGRAALSKPPLSGTFQQEWPWLSLDFP